jgi:cation:H+ antiporter
MFMAFLAIGAGLALLVWSADLFVDGAAATSRHFGMPPLLVGMVVVGFGTSAPEMAVSALSALQGSPGIALGNAYGSNITNIGLILGLTALVRPIAVHSRVLRKELPLLTGLTALSALQLWDGRVSRPEAWVLLTIFAGLMLWTIRQGMRGAGDHLGEEVLHELEDHPMPLRQSLVRLIAGLALLVVSSRALVWGAVDVARFFGVGDLVIGLTIVAIGTSLPELASSLAATRKGEHEIALGNILGSNLFNTLAVVGIAGAISPMDAGPEVFSRDIMTMSVFTLSLFLFGYGFRGPGRINRFEGTALLGGYVGYNLLLARDIFLG